MRLGTGRTRAGVFRVDCFCSCVCHCRGEPGQVKARVSGSGTEGDVGGCVGSVGVDQGGGFGDVGSGEDAAGWRLHGVAVVVWVTVFRGDGMVMVKMVLGELSRLSEVHANNILSACMH